MICVVRCQLIVTTVVILWFAVGALPLHGSAASACAHLPHAANSAGTTGRYNMGLKKVLMLCLVSICYQHIFKNILSVNYKISRQRFKENFSQEHAYFEFDRRWIDAL